MEKDKLEKIIKEHKEWVEKGDKSGKRATLWYAKLKGINLRGVNLHGVNFQQAELQDSDFQCANLSDANFFKANLENANLSETDLQAANFPLANLKGANLKKSLLTRVNFVGTQLDNADFDSVRIDQKTIAQLPEELRKKFEKTWTVLESPVEIIRSIEFPSEYYQAGISVLNYFSTIIRERYPDKEVKIRIEQDSLKVTMIITTTEGQQEIIEKTLDDYGLVVTGKMTPEQMFSDDPIQAMALRNKLEFAEMELRQTRQLLQFAEKNYQQKIESLEDQIKWMREHVGSMLQHSSKIIEKSSNDINISADGLKSASDSETKEQAAGTRVFISCAEDDSFAANKIYADLRKQGMVSWVSHKDINAGERTELAVRRAIKESDYFLVLLSTSSVNERGAFQKELKQAVDILAEFPHSEIFIVPVRLEDCNPMDDILNELHIIDLHKGGYNSGLEKIVQAMQRD
ncbi:MAG: toll/interleukin-1 receptor domain-containing protein [Desulfobacterales bacterium]|nr:toll/interleukin-1 receptor domain-containing protein [Desulfobacterales bacterium]